MAELCKFQKFTMKRINRRSIKNAQYNPRVISAAAKRKLKDNLRDVGLLGPITVNEKTGNIVGGHQRLAGLDALMGTDDYDIDVAMVALSAKREREQNVFMNNPGAQGEWDLDLLAAMLPEVKIENTGFDQVELEIMFSGTDHESFFAKDSQSAELAGNIDAVTGIANDSDAEIKDRGKSARIRADGANKDDERNTNNFAIVVFPTPLERDNFVKKLGYDRDERYVAGERLAEHMK